jgi:ribosome-associated toxin RatA of RatAB toxin-antitoxin module
MPRHSETKVLPYTAAQMFDLVADVARYPEFLPWCDQSQIVESSTNGMVAKVGMSISGIRQSFTTRNLHEPDSSVHMQLVDGPFSKLEGSWVFTPLGDGSMRACKVEFRLSYDFSSSTLAALVGPVFDKIAGSLVDAFVKRADAIYGQ